MKHLLIAGLLAVAACHSEPAKLAGTKWVAEMIGGQPVAAGVNSTLAFDDAANVSGNGACNGYGGGVQIEGSSLRFAPLRATKMACAAPAAMSQENRFFAALDQVRSFRMDGPKLELLDATGTVSVRFAVAH